MARLNFGISANFPATHDSIVVMGEYHESRNRNPEDERAGSITLKRVISEASE